MGSLNCVADILIVDDDRRLHEGIRDYLEPVGFRVRSLYAGSEVLGEICSPRPDMVLLDVMLPGGMDGFGLLQEIRRISAVPVIILTARGEETDRVVGLEMGADDYLAKPFSLRELYARIKAVLRRCRPGSTVGALQGGVVGAVKFGSYHLDLNRHQLHHKGRALELSTSEVGLLKAFLEHPGEVLSRDSLLSLAFGDDRCAGDRNIDVHISRIRSRLRVLDTASAPIRTVWGAGYRWVEDE